jgi:cytochrome o ubiquinol oxidase subunit I
MFGKLSWDAIPLNEPIPLATVFVLIIGTLGLLTLVTWKGWWPYLWREWITSGL